jgi:hypothetical protein
VLKHLDLLVNTVVLRVAHAPHVGSLMNAPQGERE